MLITETVNYGRNKFYDTGPRTPLKWHNPCLSILETQQPTRGPLLRRMPSTGRSLVDWDEIAPKALGFRKQIVRIDQIREEDEIQEESGKENLAIEGQQLKIWILANFEFKFEFKIHIFKQVGS